MAQPLALALLLSGCSRNLPPAPLPTAVVPRVSLPPLAPNHGHLVLDVGDGPTAVTQVALVAKPVGTPPEPTRFLLDGEDRALCNTTPCVATLPLGNALIGFPVVGAPGRMDVELVHVSLEPTVYRRTLSKFKPSRGGSSTVLGILGASLGGASLMTGAVFLPIGLANDNDGMTLTGSITLGAGAVLTSIGTWVLWGNAETYQPGSAIHYDFVR